MKLNLIAKYPQNCPFFLNISPSLNCLGKRKQLQRTFSVYRQAGTTKFASRWNMTYHGSARTEGHNVNFPKCKKDAIDFNHNRDKSTEMVKESKVKTSSPQIPGTSKLRPIRSTHKGAS